MATIVNSFSISGIEGLVVEIETDMIFGQPSVSIIGLGDQAVKEASERIRASILHLGYEFPKMKVVINLAPGDIKKKGSHYDLGMSIGVLQQSDQIAAQGLEEYGFIGEVSLNGKLRACNGVLPMVIAAKRAGIRKMIVPNDNREEAALVQEMEIYAFEELKEVIDFIQGKRAVGAVKREESAKSDIEYPVDFSDVKGQELLIEYIVVAAAGGHNMLMIGEPGCGKSMIAQRIPTILPMMNEEEALEVTKIYSVAGLLKTNRDLINARPFRAPHHNASLNSLIGGGNNAMPGEISLAHNGVLFLDEIAEFNKKTLDALRQPLEEKKVTISRVQGRHEYPANFMFIAAMNPCPCGYYGSRKCHCTDYEVQKYRQKLSGPLMDRVDIQKYVNPVDFMELGNQKPGPSSAELRLRVENARKIQRERYRGMDGINCNAQMTASLIKEFCQLDEPSKQLLKLAHEKFGYSARTYNKFLKVARTSADLDGSENIRRQDIARVLMARDMDKENTGMITV